MAGFAFSAINSITYRLDSRNKVGAGWLMEVGGKWVACVGKRRSEPMALDDAKRAAVSMLSTKGEPNTVDLNQIAAKAIDRAALEDDRKREFKLWPTNLLGGGKRRKPCKPVPKEDRELILADEIPEWRRPLQADYPLEYYEDGYPKLPACLDRRPLTFAKAA